MNAQKLFNKYYIATAGYAFVRKACLLSKNSKIETRDYETLKLVERPVLLTEKTAITFIAMSYSPILAPWCVFNDLSVLECKLRGKNYYDNKASSFMGHIVV
jgi:hypothetical protein